MTLRYVVETTIAAFAPEEWDRCFPDEPENWAFYRTCERAGPSGFFWYYAAAYEDARLIAAVPAFGTEYRLDTTVQGAWKSVTDRLYRLAPALMSLRLLALGSPVAEICHLGFAPEVAPALKPEVLTAMVEMMQNFGRQRRYGLFGIKDAPAVDEALWTDALASSGFTRLPGLPTAVLDLPYRTFDEYLASLSRATRKDMRRKIRAFEGIRVEQRRSIGDTEGEIARLYRDTLARSDMVFEQLPKEYFSDILDSVRPNSSIFLYWDKDELVAFNLVIEGNNRLVDKYIGMKNEAVRKYNLYFNTWLCNVRYCIEHGIPVYQSGQALYGPKLRLGCRLQLNWQYFRHGNAILNRVLRLVARFVRLDRFDPAISELVKGR